MKRMMWSIYILYTPFFGSAPVMSRLKIYMLALKGFNLIVYPGDVCLLTLWSFELLDMSVIWLATLFYKALLIGHATL